jgi:hypothetical protein
MDPLIKAQGVWGLSKEKPMPASATDDLLQQIREDRDTANLGLVANGESGACLTPEE